jgi:hypothetical protein
MFKRWDVSSEVGQVAGAKARFLFAAERGAEAPLFHGRAHDLFEQSLRTLSPHILFLYGDRAGSGPNPEFLGLLIFKRRDVSSDK